MSAYDCLKAKAAAGLISKRKGKAARDRISVMEEALKRQGERPSVARSMAEARYEEELSKSALDQKWRLINRVRVMKDLQAQVDAASPKAVSKMPMKMMDDADFEARSVHKMIMGRVGEFLQKHKVTLPGKVSDPASWKEVMKALHGEATNDASAKALAKAIHETNEWVRKKLNSYGYNIAKLDTWGIPHSHSQIAIGKAGFDAWFGEIDKRLDWAGMTNPKTGLEFMAQPSDEFRREFLEAAYKNIVYGRDSANPKWGGSMNGVGLERHRVFKFKDTDNWVAYNDKFGSADPHSTLLQHWDQMARHIALARRFGHNADTALDFLGQVIAKKNRDADAGLIAAGRAQFSTALGKNMLRVIQGGIGPNGVAQAARARFFSTTRKVLNSALLDRAIVISVPSDLNSAHLAARAIGMNQSNWFSAYVGLMADAAKGGGVTRQDLLRAGHVAESWANPGVTSSRYQADYPSAAWSETLSNAAMRIQGMNAHTDSAKLAFAWGMEGHMASIADKAFDEIHPFMRRAMDRAGITARDWDIFRAGPKFKASNGAEFLTPLHWQTAANIDPVEADRIFLTFQSFVEKWVELAVPSRSLIAQGIMDPKAYGLTPGGFLYEGLKSAGMFKSFVGAFVINQARMIDHMPTAGYKVAYVSGLIGTTTAVGALAIQVNDLLMGRDPQDMTQASFWWRSMLRGGGLGPAGDILASSTTSWGSGLPGYLAGPTITTAADAIGLTFGNVVQAYNQAIDGDDIDLDIMAEIIDFQKRYTPMWQTPIAAGGAALDRFVSDQFLMMLAPDAVNDLVKRAQKRQNLYGGGTFWTPGQALPSRMPNLGAALGQ